MCLSVFKNYASTEGQNPSYQNLYLNQNINRIFAAIDFMFAGFDIAWFIVFNNPLSLIACVLCIIGGIGCLNNI